MGATGVDIGRIQILAIAGSLLALLFVLRLLVRRYLREEVAMLAILVSLGFLVLAIWRDLLERMAFAIGIAYPPAALLLVLTLGAYMMLLHHAVVLTRLENRQRVLVQEIALLRLELERLGLDRPGAPAEEPAGPPGPDRVVSA